MHRRNRGRTRGDRDWMLDFLRGNFGFVIEFDCAGKCVCPCFSGYSCRGFSGGLIFIWMWSFGVNEERKVCFLQCGLKEQKWFTFECGIMVEKQKNNNFFRGKETNICFCWLNEIYHYQDNFRKSKSSDKNINKCAQKEKRHG